MSQFFASGGQRIGVSASASVLPMNSGLISFRMDWLDLLAVQGTLKSFSNITVQNTNLLKEIPKNPGVPKDLAPLYQIIHSDSTKFTGALLCAKHFPWICSIEMLSKRKKSLFFFQSESLVGPIKDLAGPADRLQVGRPQAPGKIMRDGQNSDLVS